MIYKKRSICLSPCFLAAPNGNLVKNETWNLVQEEITDLVQNVTLSRFDREIPDGLLDREEIFDELRKLNIGSPGVDVCRRGDVVVDRKDIGSSRIHKRN